MCTREKKEKAIAMYDTTQSITEVIRRLGYPINRKSGERRYCFGISFSAIVFLAIYKIIHSTLVLAPAFLII